MVADYTGLNFIQIGSLDIITYYTWLRDAFIASMERTEAGREYLEDAWRMEQTEPDRKRLREKFGKERK